MTEHVGLEDWVSLVFQYLEDFTPLDLLQMDAAAAARALAVPSAKVGEVDLYADVHEKAASVLIEMLHQRPLSNLAQNREVAVLTAIFFLDRNGHTWRPAQDELPYWVAEADAGRLSVRTLAQGIAQHCAAGGACD